MKASTLFGITYFAFILAFAFQLLSGIAEHVEERDTRAIANCVNVGNLESLCEYWVEM